LTSPPKTTTDLTHCNRRTYCAMHDWLQVPGGVLSTCHVVGVLAGPQQHGSAPGSQASGAESGGAGGNILMEDEDAADAATQRLLRGARSEAVAGTGQLWRRHVNRICYAVWCICQLVVDFSL
jgi:hypothetical protein